MNSTSDEKIDRLKAEISRSRTAKHKCSLQIDIAMELRHSNPDAALRQAELAMVEAEKINFALGKARSFFCRGLVYFNLSDYENSFVCLDHSFHHFKVAGDKWGMSNALNHLGLICLRLGDYPKALKNFSSSLQIKKASADRFGTANVMISMAAIYRQSGNTSHAQSLLGESLAISKSLNAGELIGKGMLELGILLMSEEKFPEAKEKFNVAKVYFTTQNNSSGMAQCLLHLGRISSTSGDPQSALALFEEGEKIAKANGDRSLLTVFLCNKAAEKIKSGYANEAITLLHEANEIARKTQEKPLLAEISKELSGAYEAVDNLKDALKEYKNFITLQEEIGSLETATILRNQQIISRVESLEKENKLLELERIAAIDKVTVLLNEQEIKSLNAMMEGQEGERRRIAADLHDRIGSALSAIKLQLNSIAKHQIENIPGTTAFGKIGSMFDDVISEVRQVSHDLASGVLIKFGLVPALRDLTAGIGIAANLKVNFFTSGADERADPQTEIALYRITQELITNIIKHAKAREVNIYLNRREGHLVLMVEDDGAGFDTSRQADGLGMKNIKWRSDKLKGTVLTDSMPGKGCTVTIEIPITQS